MGRAKGSSKNVEGVWLMGVADKQDRLTISGQRTALQHAYFVDPALASHPFETPLLVPLDVRSG